MEAAVYLITISTDEKKSNGPSTQPNRRSKDVENVAVINILSELHLNNLFDHPESRKYNKMCFGVSRYNSPFEYVAGKGTSMSSTPGETMR